jgi:hypothetical protein
MQHTTEGSGADQSIRCATVGSVWFQRIGADLRAPLVSFRGFDRYSSSIDMASALHYWVVHPGALLCARFACARERVGHELMIAGAVLSVMPLLLLFLVKRC